jgi:hypothetical protein
MALVAGKKRVPRPATGKTAFRNGLTKMDTPRKSVSLLRLLTWHFGEIATSGWLLHGVQLIQSA